MFKRIMSVMLAIVVLMSVAVVAASATEASDKVYIKINETEVFEAKKGDTFTYTYALACDQKICSLDCATTYDATGLKVVPAVDEYGDATGAEFPNITAVYNFGVEGQVIYNYSSVSGTRFPVADTVTEKNVVFAGTFEVIAESGTFEIATDLKVLGNDKNEKIVFGSEQVNTEVTLLENESIDGLSTEGDDNTGDDNTGDDNTGDDNTGDDNSDVPAPATTDQSSTDDEKTENNKNAVKTGTTAAAAVCLFTVLVMAAGLVMFSKKVSE
ncbi:MAG: hypothetical protein IJ015_05225 [Ruminococcus sp.]|nr:hypothetical protein [Ruminococcus sp.]